MTSQPAAFLVINTVKHKIDNPITRIGRKLENDIVFQDIFVSRYHAEIHCVNGNFIIRDLGSSFGTLLNNQKISQAGLNSNDLIQIANIPIVFLVEK